MVINIHYDDQCFKYYFRARLQRYSTQWNVTCDDRSADCSTISKSNEEKILHRVSRCSRGDLGIPRTGRRRRKGGEKRNQSPWRTLVLIERRNERPAYRLKINIVAGDDDGDENLLSFSSFVVDGTSIGFFNTPTVRRIVFIGVYTAMVNVATSSDDLCPRKLAGIRGSGWDDWFSATIWFSWIIFVGILSVII